MTAWMSDLMDKYGRLQLWREAIQTGDLGQTLRQSRQMAAAAQEKFNGLTVPPERDDDVVNLGSITVQQPPPRAPAFARLLVGAGLLATGVGVPIGGWLIADALRSLPPPVVPENGPDILYDLRLGREPAGSDGDDVSANPTN